MKKGFEMIKIDTLETAEQKLARHKAEFIKTYGMGLVLGEIAWLEYEGSGEYSEDIRLGRWNKSDLIFKSVSLSITEVRR